MDNRPDTRRRRIVQLLSGSALFAGPISVVQANAQANVLLSSFRMVQQENVMLHFDLSSAAVDANLFTLKEPDRLVIDLPNTTMADTIEPKQFTQGAVKGYRFGSHGPEKLRVVIDLNRPVNASFRYVPRQGGQRLIVDLGVKGNVEFAEYKARVKQTTSLRNVIVAIDAGHGGKDPGAVGQRATREKDITLKVARKLYSRLEKQPGITPVMIRNKDTYVGLRDRIRIARTKHADLFVSVHADAFKRKAAKGSSV